MRAGPWIAAYAFAVLIWWLVLAISRAPTLWRGSSVLVLNAAFVIVSIAVMAWLRLGATLPMVVLEVVLIVLPLLVRDLWFVLHVDRDSVARILEDCFDKTRARYIATEGGYVLTVAENQIRVMVGERVSGAVRLRFIGNARSKKAQLIRALIVKQFRGSFPTLRMRA